MKRWISILAPSALALSAALGCASQQRPPPPTELTDARIAYEKAASGPAAKHDASGLIQARQALATAESEYADSPRSSEVRTLSYEAQRMAEIADAEGRKTASMQASVSRSERRAKAALTQLGVSAKDEDRGTVITLPDAEMFATDQTTIRPDAKKRLTDIGGAIKDLAHQNAPGDVGRTMLLIGFTDNTGSEEHNMDLSKRRADAVRDFFEKEGLNPAKMKTEGQGEASPVADNNTEQGRAQNRRVEIIISPPNAPH